MKNVSIQCFMNNMVGIYLSTTVCITHYYLYKIVGILRN